jgi:hypothetical protein
MLDMPTGDAERLAAKSNPGVRWFSTGFARGFALAKAGQTVVNY